MSQHTKKAIMDSFQRQIEGRPLDRITVKDIVEDCAITRNTFYYHFDDIFALAKALLLEQLKQLSKEAANEGDWESFFLLLARQSIQHTRTIRHLFRTPKSRELNRFLGEILRSALETLFDHLAEGQKVPADARKLILDFYYHSISGIVQQWLEDGGRPEPEQLVHRISILLQGGMRQAITAATGNF